MKEVGEEAMAHGIGLASCRAAAWRAPCEEEEVGDGGRKCAQVSSHVLLSFNIPII
jgi:hypothetical protein